MFWTLITYFFMTICKFSSYSHLKNKSKLKFNFFMLQESPPPKDGRGVPSHRMGARVGSGARRAPLQGIESPLIGWARGSGNFGLKRPSWGGTLLQISLSWPKIIVCCLKAVKMVKREVLFVCTRIYEIISSQIIVPSQKSTKKFFKTFRKKFFSNFPVTFSVKGF